MVEARRVLVVDDEPVVTRGCRRILAGAGHRVDAAATGTEGLRRAVSGDFDVVVTDLRLPDLDGMELVRAVRDRRPEVAIIIITGYGTVPSAVEALKLGAADYIQKPFTPKRIRETISRLSAPCRREKKPDDRASLVREILRHASSDQHFGERLLTEGSSVLSEFPGGGALSWAVKAAITSGDIVRIESRFGSLSAEQRDWLERRLQAESW